MRKRTASHDGRGPSCCRNKGSNKRVWVVRRFQLDLWMFQKVRNATITQLLSLPWIVNGSVAATKAENDRGELAGRQVVYHPCATTWIIRRRNPSDGCVLIRSSWMGYTNTPFSKRNAASQKVSAAAISGLRRQDGKFLSFFIHASYGS